MCKNKLLSIAIPTYNRQECLRNTLNNLIQQIICNNYTDLIEICISDNNSNDATENVVREFLDKYPEIITYNKNKQNVIWENIKICFEKSNGKYVWFCGDDDEYFYNCVKKIISIISNNDVDGIYINQVNPIGYTTLVEKEGIYDLNNFFKIVHYDPEFISTVVVKKSSVKPKMNFYTWYHLDCLVNLPLNAKLYITKEPFILNKLPKKNAWNKNYKNALLYVIDQIELYNASNLSETIKKILVEIYTYFLKNGIINFYTYTQTNATDLKEIKYRINNLNLYNKKNTKIIKKMINSRFYSIYCSTKYRNRQEKRNFISRMLRILKIYKKLKNI